MAKLEKLIPTAIEAVAACNIVSADGTILSEFNGYISSFGASVINGGLLPAVIFYSQNGASSGRYKIITGLEYIIRVHYPALLGNYNLLNRLKNMVQANQPTGWLEEKIFDAAVALKLAIRTFPKAINNEL